MGRGRKIPTYCARNAWETQLRQDIHADRDRKLEATTQRRNDGRLAAGKSQDASVRTAPCDE